MAHTGQNWRRHKAVVRMYVRMRMTQRAAVTVRKSVRKSTVGLKRRVRRTRVHTRVIRASARGCPLFRVAGPRNHEQSKSKTLEQVEIFSFLPRAI